MPLYEYKCKECGVKFEELVTSKTQVKCPDCGSSDVGKVLSSFGFKSNGGSSASYSGGSCSGCSGGSCATCH